MKQLPLDNPHMWIPYQGAEPFDEVHFDRRIRDREHEGRVTRYIENNPVKAGLCASARAWPWSSAGKNAD